MLFSRLCVPSELIPSAGEGREGSGSEIFLIKRRILEQVQKKQKHFTWNRELGKSPFLSISFQNKTHERRKTIKER